MPKITVNGKTLEVAPGTTVIKAAIQAGFTVPHYCWHPALPVVASCRICQVEVQGPTGKRLTTACNAEVVDGMVVETETPAVAKARAGNLEGLLLNHPLDCPICDKAGECWLQDYTYEYGAAVGRNDFERRKLEKRKDIAEHVVLDQERCILCTRCVRFLDDYAKKPELVVTARGEHSVIDIFPNQPVSSEYQGNLADICPVGALTLKEFRFKNRVWYLKGADSTCPSCSRGCSITLDVRKNELNRVRPRTNLDVNGYFICDTGRFGLLDKYAPKQRLTEVLAGGTAVALDAAAEAVAARLQEVAAAGAEILVLLSPDSTNEELFLAKRVFSEAPLVAARATLGFRKVPESAGDGILRTGQDAANVAGARAAGLSELGDAELDRKLASGKVGAALVFDGGVAKLAARPGFLVVGAVASPLAAGADAVFPGHTAGEKDGTITNCQNRTQRLRAALKAPASAPGEFRALAAIGSALGLFDLPQTPADAFVALADAAGDRTLTLSNLPPNGTVLGGARVPTESKP